VDVAWQQHFHKGIEPFSILLSLLVQRRYFVVFVFIFGLESIHLLFALVAIRFSTIDEGYRSLQDGFIGYDLIDGLLDAHILFVLLGLQSRSFFEGCDVSDVLGVKLIFLRNAFMSHEGIYIASADQCF
jgi:hypothetical protein